MERPEAGAPLIERPDVAKLLRTTERHVDRLVQERRIPFVRVGGKTRFEPEAIAEWIAANRVAVGEPS